MPASVAVVEDIGIYSRSSGFSPNGHDVATRIFKRPTKRAVWVGGEPQREVSKLTVRELQHAAGDNDGDTLLPCTGWRCAICRRPLARVGAIVRVGGPQ